MNLKTTLGSGALLLLTGIAILASAALRQFRNPAAESQLSYNLDAPSATIVLPTSLHEISGLTWWGKHELAGVQDEDGYVFVIDVKKGVVENREKFTKDGDYEGIAKAGKKLFIVRSDGTLYKVKDFDKKKQETIVYQTPLTSQHDVEGLCYDKLNQRLLLLCKEKSGLQSFRQGTKSIFAFDLTTNTFVSEFELVLSVAEVDRALRGHENHGLSAEFKPSGIAIHPVTNRIYIISSVAKVIVVLDQNAKVFAVHQLSSTLFEQPEGIAFSPKGNLYVSNEARTGDSNVLKFKYLPVRNQPVTPQLDDESQTLGQSISPVTVAAGKLGLAG